MSLEIVDIKWISVFNHAEYVTRNVSKMLFNSVLKIVDVERVIMSLQYKEAHFKLV